MTDLSETEAAAGKGGNAVVRAVARALFNQTWREENPDADREARKAAWAKARGDEVKKARKLVRALERAGVALTLTPKAEETAGGQDSDD